MVTINSANEKTAASGKVLQGQGVGTASDFSSATYPSTAGTAGKVLISDGTNIVSSTPTYPNAATGTGTILRADGTNWVASTSTYPDTNAVSTLLYASSANVMGALATANGGVLTTSSTGVPSIDTTNFVRQTTGMQVKGNNTNTAPPAGFLGERITATATSVATTSAAAKSITSITLTAGIWDVTAIAFSIPTGGTAVMQLQALSISTTDNTLTGTLGDQLAEFTGAAIGASTITVPAIRATLSSNTIYYAVVRNDYTSTTCPTNARISGVRVG